MSGRAVSGSDDRAPDPADDDGPRADLDATPPLLGSWRNLYLLVVGSQAVVALLFYLVTRVYE